MRVNPAGATGGPRRHAGEPVRLRAGFTLIELLIVTAILGTVIGVVGACLSGGIRVWDAARTFNEVESKAFFCEAVIRRDLANMVAVPALGFVGQPGAMEFPVLARGAGDGETATIRMLKYAFEADEGRIVRHARALPAGEPWRETLLDGAGSLKLRFYRRQEEEGGKASWEELKVPVTNFPDRVQVRFAIGAGAPGEIPEFETDMVLPVHGDARTIRARL
jgi:prepilin-type N-terminal cleavage/methylation domain-containing protein